MAFVITKLRFNTQPPEGGWLTFGTLRNVENTVSTHSRPKAAGFCAINMINIPRVSTHSRPKAAGQGLWQSIPKDNGFNTQPPEGGWQMTWNSRVRICRFQHTAARRRLDNALKTALSFYDVSTHSRPKAAGYSMRQYYKKDLVSTHSRPKAAGTANNAPLMPIAGFNTQPPEGGWPRLRGGGGAGGVSTHSRPKAAGSCFTPFSVMTGVSTHSRPKAAGPAGQVLHCKGSRFQHTAARRRLGIDRAGSRHARMFQHTAARRRLGW